MRTPARISIVAIAVLAGGGVALADDKAAKHTLPPSPNGDLVVGLCDGTTSTIVKGKKPGEALTAADAKKVTDELMAEWKR
jgi:hypothetical protein